MDVLGHSQSFLINYGGSFAGFGDLQGKYISIGYTKSIHKLISLNLSINKSSMSGNKISYVFAGQPVLGLDYTSQSIIDIDNFINNGEIINERLLKFGSEFHYDPPFNMINEFHIDLGASLNIYKTTKFNYYIEGNLSIVKMEVVGTILTRSVYINEESWINNLGPERKLNEVIILSNFQDHFLDYGFGYGFGIDYNLYEYFTIGANSHYNQYMNDAQNFVTWGLRLSLKI
jgi:hypothetical protein